MRFLAQIGRQIRSWSQDQLLQRTKCSLYAYDNMIPYVFVDAQTEPRIVYRRMRLDPLLSAADNFR